MPISQHGWPEVLIFLVSFLLITLLDRRHPIGQTEWYYSLNNWLLRATYLPHLAYGYLTVFTIALLVLLSLLGWPFPMAPEEYSNYLAADTFAHGRLSNPTHPLWTFFETMQVVSKPFYASKYPPAPGLLMALGQVVAGSPVVGIWLTYLAGVLAVYWLLTLCLPPVPALVGGALVASHATFILNWGVGFWGGGGLMLGGALMLGGTIALLRQPRGKYVFFVGLGMFLLWTTRPFEGLVFSLIPGGALLYMTQQVHYWHGFRSLLRWIPGFLLVMLTVATLPIYNRAVTDDPFRTPYSYYYKQYEQARLLVFQQAKREPFYNRPEMKRLHKREAALFMYRQTIDGFVEGIGLKLLAYGGFYLGLMFLLPFILFLISPKSSPEWLALWSIALLMGVNLFEAQELPDSLAPATGALALAVGVGLVLLWQAQGRWRVWGQRFVLAIVLSALPLLVWEGIGRARSVEWRTGWHRLADEEYLRKKGGQHVVLVNYAREHPVRREWVYNGADIGRQAVIWALDKGGKQNRALFRYYPGRTFWQLRPDENPGRLYRLKIH